MALKHVMRADERLTRQGQQDEQFICPTESALESLIVIGASAGGFVALQEAVKGLSGALPAAVIILLHSMMKNSGYGLEHVLARSTEMPIQVIQAGDRLQGGRIYVTPSGHSAYLQQRTLQLEVKAHDSPETTINRLFESAAKAYQDRVIGVVLTGMLRDGTAGLKAV